MLLEQLEETEECYKEFIPFLKERYKGYEVYVEPWYEVDTSYDVDSSNDELARIWDNLILEKGDERVVLPNRGFDNFRGFGSLKEVVEFLDNTLKI